MEILPTHRHIMRFSLDKFAPPKYIARWNRFKNKSINTTKIKK